MALPISPPYLPTEALSVNQIPSGKEGRTSQNGMAFFASPLKTNPISSYSRKAVNPLPATFRSLVPALREIKAARFLLDDEIVVPLDGTFPFDDLLQRIQSFRWPSRFAGGEYCGKGRKVGPCTTGLSSASGRLGNIRVYEQWLKIGTKK